MSTQQLAGDAWSGASADTEPVPNFYGLTRKDLASRMTGMGLPGYRATQLYSWVYQKHEPHAEQMNNLPRALRERLGAYCEVSLPEVASVHSSADGLTHKFVLALRDGSHVECVSMRTEKRLTYCTSSQAGCALACAFCATGVMGLKRNLRAEEIVAQVVLMQRFNGWRERRFNLVFMGMGEPLVNYGPVMQAIHILHDTHGLDVGARRITVSTCGIVPQMDRLAEEGLPLGLALSLHATTDELRDRLVPVNKRFPLAQLIPAAHRYGRRTGRRVTLEYVLLAGVNDGPEDARRLARIARQIPSKVNLIPYNPVPGLPWERPTPESVQAFAEWLYPHAPAVMVRNTQGSEIWAACGQLGGLSPDV
jgi:23S rRNA (adenine2503-C2)-methyltransferase